MAVQIETRHWIDIPGGKGVLYSSDRSAIKTETNVLARVQPIAKGGPAKVLLKGIGLQPDALERAQILALDAIARNKSDPRPPGIPTGDVVAHQQRMTPNPNSIRQLQLRSATQLSQLQMPMMMMMPLPGMMGMCGMNGMMGGMGMPFGMSLCGIGSGLPPPPPPPASPKVETASSDDASDACSSSSAPEEALTSKANETKEEKRKRYDEIVIARYEAQKQGKR